jgi:hypothetical protein
MAVAHPQLYQAWIRTPTQHKSTAEPVIRIITEVLGFRQFSLRSVIAAAGGWCLVLGLSGLKPGALHELATS